MAAEERWWQDGSRLVVARDGELPHFCVRCGEPGVEALPRKLSWSSRWLLIFVLGGLFLYVIVAMIAAKRSKLTIWLCGDHAAARRRDVRIGWAGLGLIALSFVALIYGGSVVPRPALGVLSISELVLLVAGAALGLYGYYRSKVVGAARIDATHVWVTGVTPLMRSSLPLLPGASGVDPVASSSFVKCPKCWNTNDPERTTCRICGSQLPAPSAA